MYKIGVIGDKTSIQGFLALGIDIFPAVSEEEIKENLSRCVKNDYAVIYITEQALAKIGDETRKWAGLTTPAIIPIPGSGGSLGLGMSNVKKFVERAVGSDILGD